MDSRWLLRAGRVRSPILAACASEPVLPGVQEDDSGRGTWLDLSAGCRSEGGVGISCAGSPPVTAAKGDFNNQGDKALRPLGCPVSFPQPPLS